MTIRRPTGEAAYPRLVEIWRSAVDATHDFLTVEDRDEIESHLASDYFPAVELSVAEVGGSVVGFAGVHGQNLEMLFVDDASRGGGIGSALLEHVVAEVEVQTVDVNEQNPQAVGFYLHRGFVVTSRSERDDQGRPYPLLHMRLGEAQTS